MKTENYKLEIANSIGVDIGATRDRLNSSTSPNESASPNDFTASSTHCAMSTHCTMKPAVFNFHFSLFTFYFRILLFVLCALLFPLCQHARAQTITDKMVATVTNGSRATPDLITYSDLIWQLALETETPFSERPTSEQLSKALHTREDQLLVLQEARKLPGADSPEAQKEFEEAVKGKRDELAKTINSPTLAERMSRVGLTSEQLDAILRDRVTIERYLDFRFRAFVVIGQKEISDRYNQQYASQRNTGRIVPTLDQARSRIEHDLIEEKIASEIDEFVDNLRDQPGTEVVVLNPV